MKADKEKMQSRVQPWRQQRRERTNIWLYSLEIGLFAGLIWGGVKGYSFI